jgi:hypothetical protein
VDVASWLRSHRNQQCQSAFQGSTITPRYCETASGLKDLGTSPVKHQRKLLAASQHSATILAIPIERPRLTVIFCELVGSITLAGILDPKDLHRVSPPTLRAMGDTTACSRDSWPKDMGDSAHPCDNQF